MMAGKRVNKFSALAARDLATVQLSHVRSRFELAERSVVGEAAVGLVNQALDDYESDHGLRRVKPGEMVVEHQGEKLILPLLETNWVARLERDMELAEVKRQHEHDQYSVLIQADPEATYGTLWQLLGRTENKKRAPKGYDFLPEEPLSDDGPSLLPRRPEDMQMVPPEVMESVSGTLVKDYGCRPAQAEAMIKVIAGLRAWCCPRIEELKPGQVVWFAHSTRKSRRRDPRLLVPVILTLMGPDEQDKLIRHHGELKELRIRQIERMTTEAWKQDAVLTNSDVEWLTGLSASAIRQLLEAYQEKFGIILPTAGTILDLGRTLTHKKIVVEMALGGLTTKEIARKIYHTEEAVDAYLRTFDKLLMLKYHKLPATLMVRVLDCSRKLLEEYMALAEKHLPGDDAIKHYLTNRGIPLDEVG